MNRYLITILLTLIFTNCKRTYLDPVLSSKCLSENQISEQIVSASAIKAMIDNYTAKRLYGVTFMARKGNQYWQYNSGWDNKENGLAIKPCLIWPGYSISKMYTATAIMKLVEDNQIKLDQKINSCLPIGVLSKVPDTDKITIRMLLNHSSGIENFWQNFNFIKSYTEDPTHSYTLNEYLEASQERLFKPGTNISYSNSNYLLLSVIIDYVTGQQHEKAFQKYIYKPLFLSGTFYKILPASLQGNTPHLYADVTGEGNLIDYTTLSHIQFKNESGSNSIMATPKDFVDFIHGLTHGKLLNTASFSEMKKEYSGIDNTDNYGLGLEFFEKNGTKMYGHSGSSFGGRTLLLYNPKTDICFFIGVNAGAELGGPVLENIVELMNALITAMSQ